MTTLFERDGEFVVVKNTWSQVVNSDQSVVKRQLQL